MAIAEACFNALKNYINDPWQWPRESDIVCHMVQDIKTNLGPANSKAKAEIIAKSKPSFTIPNLSTPRVRTEVKIDGAPLPWRVDVCVQPEEGNTVFIGGHGVRDVVLTVSPNQIEEVLEVKMYPGLLMPLRNGRYTASWIDDLIKLHLIKSYLGNKCAIKSLHALFIDTSLLLHSVVPESLPSSRNTETKRQNNENPPFEWPLKCGESNSIKPYQYPTRADGKEWRIYLKQCIGLPGEPEDDAGIYLWAIGLKGDSLPTSSNRSKVIANGQAVPACWKVSVVPAV